MKKPWKIHQICGVHKPIMVFSRIKLVNLTQPPARVKFTIQTPIKTSRSFKVSRYRSCTESFHCLSISWMILGVVTPHFGQQTCQWPPTPMFDSRRGWKNTDIPGAIPHCCRVLGPVLGSTHRGIVDQVPWTSGWAKKKAARRKVWKVPAGIVRMIYLRERCKKWARVACKNWIG